MDKKKLGQGIQFVALITFVAMALACGSQTEVVDGLRGSGGDAGGSDGAAIELPADSVPTFSDLAMN